MRHVSRGSVCPSDPVQVSRSLQTTPSSKVSLIHKEIIQGSCWHRVMPWEMEETASEETRGRSRSQKPPKSRVPARAPSTLPRQETMQSPTESSGAVRRKRNSMACNTCNKRKARCDGQKPGCSACVRFGVVCSYDRVVKKRGPKAGYLAGLKQRLSTFEKDLLLKMAGVVPEEGHGSPITDKSLCKSDTVGLLRASSCRLRGQRDRECIRVSCSRNGTIDREPFKHESTRIECPFCSGHFARRFR